ncbi:MAG: hypothetical protein WB992_24220 [Bryobacteraceae bacterium]
MEMGVLAYFLTFASYGTHLPGSEKGWVDIQHRTPGSPLRAGNTRHESYWRSRLNETPWTLDAHIRETVLQSMVSVCTYRNWIAYAIHVRSTHVHAVIGGEAGTNALAVKYVLDGQGARMSCYPK